MVADHFVVDRDGLAKLMRKRPKGYIVLELLQNAWDENVTKVDLILSYYRGTAFITVTDDAPEGFADLTHAYTLFAESNKKTDPTKRGRFNLGEKLVIALCETAEIRTTKGQVSFNRQGRQHSRNKTTVGTIFTGRIRMTKAEFVEMMDAASVLIPPIHIETTLNGSRIEPCSAAAVFEASLPTEIAGDDGYLKRVQRTTSVEVYEPYPGETAMLYEMGIPVVETEDRWNVNIMQKVLLNTDRDNVTPPYLRRVRTVVLNEMASRLDPEASTATWVNEALGDKDVDEDAVRNVVQARFGDRTVITDPSDREAEKRAVAEGYTVIPARAFTAGQWANVRKARVSLPAGQVTPTPKPFSADGKPLRIISREDWPMAAAEGVEELEGIAGRMVDGNVRILAVNDGSWPFTAACGPDCQLYINVARVGWAWFSDEVGQRQLELLIHELAHVRVSDHLSEQYAHELCRLGARLALSLATKGE
jgi:hypothetical protein